MKLTVLLYDGSEELKIPRQTDAFGLLLYGGLPDVHDYHAGKSGAMMQALKQAATAGKAKTPIVAITTLTRSNYLVLNQILVVLKRLKIRRWVIYPPDETAKPLQESPQRFLARFALAYDKLKTLKPQAEAEGIKVYATNFPLCLNPLPQPQFELTAEKNSVANIPPKFEQTYKFGKICQICKARQKCAGIGSVYLNLYGDSEFEPIE